MRKTPFAAREHHAMPSHRIGRETKGLFVIAATPFTENGAVDFASIDTMVDFYLEKEATGLTILGVMGEANKLTQDESRQVASAIVKRVDDRVPVVVGVSGPGTDNLRALAHDVMAMGAAGVMVAPTAGRPLEDRVVRYIGEVCEALGPDVPVCYQDYPQTTGVPVSVETILKLASSFKQVVMLKHEDCPGLAKVAAVRGRTGTGGVPRLSILCGNGGLYLPQELARGADGAMTGFAYPEMLARIVALFAKGEADAAEDIYDAYLPILRYEQQPGYGLAVRKTILRKRGAIASARTRAPGPTLSADDTAELDRLMARTERKVAALA
jgi:4-hydroxy-tetrahydrodipicolinate synthase